MNFIKIVAVLSLLAFLSACTLGSKSPYEPEQEEINNAYYGDEPKNYKEIIEAIIRPILREPKAGIFTNYSIPKKDWLARWEGFTNVKYFGWLVCVDVNGKNAYGGYTGAKAYYFLFQDERIVFHQTESNIKEVSWGTPNISYPILCKY